MVLIPPSYRISGSTEGTTLKIIKIHSISNDYSCPLIDTGGITLKFKVYLKKQYIGPKGLSSKAIRGFSGSLSDLERQLSEIEI